MYQHEEQNPAMEYAAKFIQQSNQAVFLTGKAGTGKTTFLKEIRSIGYKHAVVVAPTGVAAVNAGGTTIHSFFQLPFGPYVPGSNLNEIPFGQNQGKQRLSQERKALIQSMDLLVIDEVSMVRCDLLDGIDAVLRQVRKQPSLPFGGVQVLYIGDLYQLPPVVKEADWRLLQAHYETAFFFSSKVFASQPPVYIELEKVYRQKDQEFITLLNKVRNNEMDEQGYRLLQSRYRPDFIPDEKDFYITLTTHNHKADAINAVALEKIKQAPRFFKAAIEGEFPENAFPAEETLCLKVGARVMFLRNDTEKIRRYYNGKIAVIEKIEDDAIQVSCVENESTVTISLKREVWENIRYQLNPKSKQIEETSLGSFTQFPLRLAWAITIHKSQGLTFAKAIIDAEQAFAPGQVYVALSRCSNLDGLLLKSNIAYKSLFSDPKVVEFTQSQKTHAPSEIALENARKSYQQHTLRQLFQFDLSLKQLNELIRWNLEHPVFSGSVASWLQTVLQQIKPLQQHAQKFSQELEQFFLEEVLPEQHATLQHRISKACGWFGNAIEMVILELKKSPAITDNRQHATEYQKMIQGLFETLYRKRQLMETCKNGYVAEQVQASQKNDPVPFSGIVAYAAQTKQTSEDMPHPELYLRLQEKRNELASEEDKPIYMVCSTESLKLMAQYLPQNPTNLKKIKGMGPHKIKQYGTLFLSIILDYCAQNNIMAPENISLVASKKEPVLKKKAVKDSKESSAVKTIQLFLEGNALTDIMRLRNFTQGTIESHLLEGLENGMVTLNQLLSTENQVLIRSVLENQEIIGLKMAKEQLPEHISYGQIRWVLSFLKKERVGGAVQPV